MALNADMLLDRMRLKQQLRRWKIMTVIAAAVLILASIGTLGDSNIQPGSYIARYRVEGIIVDNPKRDKLLADLEENDNVKAVLVTIDSPGGTVVGGEALYEQLRKLSQHKPVVAVLRTLATSAAYMGAVGTDYIVAQQGSVTGSIGVLMQSFEATELSGKLGIKPVIFKSSPLKATPNPMEKVTPDVADASEALILDFYEVFKNMVKERRQLDEQEVTQVADGRVFTGRQALKLKLVDVLGGEQEALDWLQKQRHVDTSLPVRTVKEPRDPKDWFGPITSSLGWSNPLSAPMGLLAIWQPGSF